ncbi:hypothetical protein [Thalassoroseus pseudoceratinae]|uniref:hypothetical protein n=1 Tax=Thalassoroseus pseudoceratinae TaxID=2713176 RepID=UPI00142328BD|nr:hypothetical protein [Thalassoroseus pseudoceratinae]
MSSSFIRWSRHSASLGNYLFFAAIIALIAAIWGGLYWWERHRVSRTESNDTPNDLFQQLCKVHRLSVGEQQLLSQVAQATCASQPALVFVDHRCLQSQGEGGNAEQLRDLARKLFGPAKQ